MLLCEGGHSAAKKNVKALESLVTLFWQNKNQLGFRLMGQLAQAIQFVMRSYECSELLLVSRQFDKLKVYFSHLVDTLNYLTNPEV
jgi:hypothetical protein